MNVKILLSISIALYLSACGTNQVKPVQIDTVPIQKAELKLPDPEPLKLRPVTWFIITPENASTVFAELQKKKYSSVLFGLTDDGYENLSLNIAEIRAYISEQKEILNSYRSYYEPKVK